MKISQGQKIYDLISSQITGKTFSIMPKSVIVFLEKGSITFYMGRTLFAPGENTPSHLKADFVIGNDIVLEGHSIGDWRWVNKKWKFVSAVGDTVKKYMEYIEGLRNGL